MKLRLAAGVLLLIPAASAARAETLAEALALAYQSNPSLESQRAQLKATDEGLVQAKAGLRPTVSGQANLDYTRAPELLPFFGTFTNAQSQGLGELTLNQPLYTGGKVTAQMQGAEAQIAAGREQLRSVEAQTLLGATQAYLDVLRDRDSLQIQQQGRQIMQSAVAEIRARREAGANTVTDVAQAEAQLQATIAQVTSARAQLEASQAEYVAAVGQSPGDLTTPPPLPDMPATLDDAYQVAEDESPALRQAKDAEAAAADQVRAARAAGHLSIGITASYGYLGPVNPIDRKNFGEDVAVGVTITQPLLTGGLIGSQVRQALDQQTAARIAVEVARRSVVQAVTQAWSQMQAAKLNVDTQAAQVKAAETALEGMRIEYRAGLRETLDVLIAEQTLVSARSALEAAQHDAYLAAAEVLASVGRMEARVVLQGVPLYQPQAALRRVENKGALPLDVVPRVIDRLGEPGAPRPQPIPQPPLASGPIRMTPAASQPAAPTPVPPPPDAPLTTSPEAS